MSEEIRKKGRDFAEFLKRLPEDERRKGNKKEFLRAQEEHTRFKQAYHSGECYLCNKPLKSFNKKNPCIHWLLKPKGFGKKDLVSITNNYGIFQIQSLLRWYANEEAFAKNINNLTEEGTGTKMIELTIKYKNLEWSFSCAESDYLGHQKTQHSKHPHYHFQMRIDKRPFINFKDFHLPLSEMDIINITAMNSKPNLLKLRNSFGEGMNEVFTKKVIDHMLNTATTVGNQEEASLRIESFAYAKEGETINEDDVNKIMQEAKEKGVTVASLLHKLPNAETKIIVSPGPGVIEQAPRSKRKKST